MNCNYCSFESDTEWSLHIHISKKHPNKKTEFERDEEVKEKISQGLEGNDNAKGKELSKQVREKISENVKKAMEREEVQEKLKENNPMKCPEVRKKVSKTRKRKIVKGKIDPVTSGAFEEGREFTPEIEEKRKRNSLKGLMKRPTSLEKDFMRIIDEYNIPFRYVGDGDVWINGKNPDFIHENKDMKICIEVSNRVFRDEESYAKPRRECFRESDWLCLVFFGSYALEDNDEKILSKVERCINHYKN